MDVKCNGDAMFMCVCFVCVDFCFAQAFVCFNRVPFLVCKLLFDGQRISFRCFIKFFFRLYIFFSRLLLLLFFVVALAASLPRWWCFSSLIHTYSRWDSVSSFLASFFFGEEFLRELWPLLLLLPPLLWLLLPFILLCILFSLSLSLFCCSFCFSKCTWAYFVGNEKKEEPNRPFGWKDVGPNEYERKKNTKETTVCLVCSYLYKKNVSRDESVDYSILTFFSLVHTPFIFFRYVMVALVCMIGFDMAYVSVCVCMFGCANNIVAYLGICFPIVSEC